MPENQHRYYIEESFSDRLFNAGILRKEHEKILQSGSYRPLRFLQTSLPSPLLQALRLLQAFRMAIRLPKGSRVVFHFPLLAGMYGVLLKLLHLRGIQTIGILIDADGLRYNRPRLLAKELKQLRRFNALVVHNNRMAGWLCPRLPGITCISIGLFDHPGNAGTGIRQQAPVICYAGNLSKAGFISGLPEISGILFHLYGEGAPAGISQGNIVCHPPQSPAALPEQLEGAYGLIWDGPSTRTCDDYLQYNTPHKASLYLLAGLPLIVWKKSALAGWVEEEQLGCTVEDLHALPGILKTISPEQYAQWRMHAQEKGRELSRGNQLRNALGQLDQD